MASESYLGPKDNPETYIWVNWSRLQVDLLVSYCITQICMSLKWKTEALGSFDWKVEFMVLSNIINPRLSLSV